MNKILAITFLVVSLVFPLRVHGYSNNMPASVVVGQQNFTSGSANQGGSVGSNTLSSPKGVFIDPYGRLIIADAGNHRVLIWNSVPTSNNTSADLVLGQADFTSSSANRGGTTAANTFNNPYGVFSDGTKLVVADRTNHRVLIWNTFPTSNGQSADVVVGQTDMTTGTTGACNTVGLDDPVEGIWIYNNKLIVSSKDDRRILIWNSVPTSNGASADVVLGQADFVSCGFVAPSSSSVNQPRGIAVDRNGRLYVVADDQKRVLIWNSIPTENNKAGDLVIGQNDFTSITGGTSASTFKVNQSGISIDGDRVFLADRDNNRIVIFNSLPTSNGTSADIVIGQSSFTSSSANGGVSTSASGFSVPDMVFAKNNKLFVADTGQHRVLIFENLIKQPGITLNNSPEGRENNQLRFYGMANVDSPYLLHSVEYSVNGGGWSSATSNDGGFDELSEDFFFDFDPKTNNQSKEGYVVQVKAKNNNTDEVDRLTYFEPFRLHAPENNARTENQSPSFSFTVNSQRQLLYEGLQKYMVMIKKGKADWTTYADEIPVNYDYAKDNADNIAEKKNGTNGNGVYEDSKIRVTYSDDGARLEVYSKQDEKKLIGGSYQWKVVAVDKAGHTQETGSRYLRVASSSFQSGIDWFPLTIEFMSGLGKTDISTLHPQTTKAVYTTNTGNPTISGTAVASSTVTLTLTEKKCITDTCTKTFTTTTDQNSKYSFKLPNNTIQLGKKYDFLISVSFDNEYNELPIFTFSKRSYNQ